MILVNKWGLRNIDEYGFLEKAVTVSKVGSRERDLAQINIQETKAVACWLLFFFFFFILIFDFLLFSEEINYDTYYMQY